MKYLVIDIGNTNAKYGCFESHEGSDHLVEMDKIMDWNVAFLDLLISKLNPKRTLISSVREVAPEMLSFCKKRDILWLDSILKMPFKSKYTSPNTLGPDRMAAVAGGISLYPKQPVLVIDAGTCITYEWIDGQGNYLGGSISPGLHMRYAALHQMTEKLPLLKPMINFTKDYGDNTADAIHSGILRGLIAEIDVFVETFYNKMKNSAILLCGGDAELIKKNSKHKLRIEQHLVLLGLLKILQVND